MENQDLEPLLCSLFTDRDDWAGLYDVRFGLSKRDYFLMDLTNRRGEIEGQVRELLSKFLTQNPIAPVLVLDTVRTLGWGLTYEDLVPYFSNPSREVATASRFCAAVLFSEQVSEYLQNEGPIAELAEYHVVPRLVCGNFQATEMFQMLSEWKSRPEEIYYPTAFTFQVGRFCAALDEDELKQVPVWITSKLGITIPGTVKILNKSSEYLAYGSTVFDQMVLHYAKEVGLDIKHGIDLQPTALDFDDDYSALNRFLASEDRALTVTPYQLIPNSDRPNLTMIAPTSGFSGFHILESKGTNNKHGGEPADSVVERMRGKQVGVLDERGQEFVLKLSKFFPKPGSNHIQPTIESSSSEMASKLENNEFRYLVSTAPLLAETLDSTTIRVALPHGELEAEIKKIDQDHLSDLHDLAYQQMLVVNRTDLEPREVQALSRLALDISDSIAIDIDNFSRFVYDQWLQGKPNLQLSLDSITKSILASYRFARVSDYLHIFTEHPLWNDTVRWDTRYLNQYINTMMQAEDRSNEAHRKMIFGDAPHLATTGTRSNSRQLKQAKPKTTHS